MESPADFTGSSGAVTCNKLHTEVFRWHRVAEPSNLRWKIGVAVPTRQHVVEVRWSFLPLRCENGGPRNFSGDKEN